MTATLRHSGLLLIALLASAKADGKTKKQSNEDDKGRPSENDRQKIPAECLRDEDPSGAYEVTLVSVPMTPEPGTVLPPQCRAIPTGTKVDAVYDVAADVDANYIRVTHGDSIIRDPKLQRSVTEICKHHGVTEPRVTWFSWKEFMPAKNGWNWVISGFGAGDAKNSRVLRRISLIELLQDREGTPICYAKLDSEDS